MNTDHTKVRNSPPPHPGKLLDRVLLRNYQLTASDLANSIANHVGKSPIDASYINNIIDGKSDITIEVANALRPIFGMAANGLLRMQEVYNFYIQNGRRPSQNEKKNFPVYE